MTNRDIKLPELALPTNILKANKTYSKINEKFTFYY